MKHGQQQSGSAIDYTKIAQKNFINSQKNLVKLNDSKTNLLKDG